MTQSVLPLLARIDLHLSLRMIVALVIMEVMVAVEAAKDIIVKVVVAKEAEQNIVDVLLVSTAGREVMFKRIIGKCLVDPCYMQMQLLLRRMLVS